MALKILFYPIRYGREVSIPTFPDQLPNGVIIREFRKHCNKLLQISCYNTVLELTRKSHNFGHGVPILHKRLFANHLFKTK